MQDRIDELAKQYVDQMAALDGRCDFVNDVALHFPLQVILSILGLPEDDYARMLQLTQELFGAEDPDIARMGEDESRSRGAAGLRELLHRAGRPTAGPTRPTTSRR